MDSTKIPLVICLTVLIVVGVNATLLVALRRGNDVGQIELFKRAASRARRPWIHEDEALVELSKRVADLKRGEEQQGSGGPGERGGRGAATGELRSQNVAWEQGSEEQDHREEL
jgi:hypothetical protein